MDVHEIFWRKIWSHEVLCKCKKPASEFLDNCLPSMNCFQLSSNLSIYVVQEAITPKALEHEVTLFLVYVAKEMECFLHVGYTWSNAPQLCWSWALESYISRRENSRGLQHIIVMPLVGYRMDSPENMEQWTTQKRPTLLTAANACERCSEETL